jgi:hypothetical protein
VDPTGFEPAARGWQVNVWYQLHHRPIASRAIGLTRCGNPRGPRVTRHAPFASTSQQLHRMPVTTNESPEHFTRNEGVGGSGRPIGRGLPKRVIRNSGETSTPHWAVRAGRSAKVTILELISPLFMRESFSPSNHPSYSTIPGKARTAPQDTPLVSQKRTIGNARNSPVLWLAPTSCNRKPEKTAPIIATRRSLLLRARCITHPRLLLQ